MGACFATMVLPGELVGAEVKERFLTEQEVDRYENGHSYSGGLGMARGLRLEAKSFESPGEAHKYIQERAQKWEEAIAVRYTDKQEVRQRSKSYRDEEGMVRWKTEEYPNPDLGKTYWLIGAWCAS